jgi:hypothetical protein
MKIKKVITWTFSFLVMAILATSSIAVSTNIVSTTCTQVSPPASVEQGQTESDTDILLFNEQTNFTLPSSVFVNISAPGSYVFPITSPSIPSPLTPATIPAGTVVDSFFLHFDPVGSTFPPIVTADCSVTFDCPIIGVAAFSTYQSVVPADLDNSNGLGAAGTTYPGLGVEPFWGLEERDIVTISSDSLTLTVHLESSLFTDNIRVITECPPPPPPGNEGCTPGYWKNHTDAWEGHDPGDLVGSVFTIPGCLASCNLGSKTLLQALSFRGGSNNCGAAQILLRAAVAALLNASHSGVDYPRTEAQVIADVNAALASCNRSTILSLAEDLDADNNLGCPLN